MKLRWRYVALFNAFVFAAGMAVISWFSGGLSIWILPSSMIAAIVGFVVGWYPWHLSRDQFLELGVRW